MGYRITKCRLLRKRYFQYFSHSQFLKMIRDIFNTYRQAFRIYIRQRSRPKSYEEAEEKRLFWSKCYMFAAFGSFIVATIITAKENLNFSYAKDKSKEEAVLEKLIDYPGKVYKYKNFKKVDEYDFVPVSGLVEPNSSGSENK